MKESIFKKNKKILLSEKKRIEDKLKQLTRKSKHKRERFQAKFIDLGQKEDENAAEVTIFSDRLSLKDNLEKNLRNIEHALQRIKEGKYGICEKCGKPIQEKRLKIFPSATLCIKCKIKK